MVSFLLHNLQILNHIFFLSRGFNGEPENSLGFRWVCRCKSKAILESLQIIEAAYIPAKKFIFDVLDGLGMLKLKKKRKFY